MVILLRNYLNIEAFPTENQDNREKQWLKCTQYRRVSVHTIREKVTHDRHKNCTVSYSPVTKFVDFLLNNDELVSLLIVRLCKTIQNNYSFKNCWFIVDSTQ